MARPPGTWLWHGRHAVRAFSLTARSSARGGAVGCTACGTALYICMFVRFNRPHAQVQRSGAIAIASNADTVAYGIMYASRRRRPPQNWQGPGKLGGGRDAHATCTFQSCCMRRPEGRTGGGPCACVTARGAPSSMPTEGCMSQLECLLDRSRELVGVCAAPCPPGDGWAGRRARSDDEAVRRWL